MSLGACFIMSKRKIFTFLVCFLILTSFTILIFATNSATKNGNKSSEQYTINSNLILKDNKQFKTLKDQIIFASCDNNKTIVGKLDLQSGEVFNISQINGLYDNLIIDKENIYITQKDTNNESTKFYRVNDNINFDINTCTNTKDSVVISDNFIYMINCTNRKNIVKYNFADINNITCEYTYSLTYNAVELVKTSNEDILANTQVETYSLKGNEALITTGVDFKDGIKTLENGTISDYSGNIYGYNNLEFTKIYKSFADDFNFICANKSSNFVLINNRIFLLDKNGTALKQFTLNENGSSLILTTNNYLNNLIIQNQSVSIETFDINNSSEDITYDDYNKDGEDFKADPAAGNIAYDNIKSLDKWQVYFDANVLSARDKGQPRVVITDNNTGKTYLRSVEQNNLTIDKNGWAVSFLPADEINNHEYTVKVLDLNNKIGEPASCTYDINVINTPQTDKIDSQTYNINRSLNTISNITPGTSLAEFKANLIYIGNLEIKSISGNILSSGKIGTGAKLSLFQDGSLKDQLTVIIYGDLNGDSTIGSADVKLAENYLLGKEQLNDAAKIAFDVNHDGNCNSLDLLLMKKSIKGLYTINQNDL